ncbi:hypothetical protein ACVWWI_005585 [Bradyrhizobium sp. USDA 3686]
MVARQHLARREGEALQDVELGDDADDLSVVLDRIGIEIIALEHLAQREQVEVAPHCPDVLRHVAFDGLFKESVHGASSLIGLVSLQRQCDSSTQRAD